MLARMSLAALRPLGSSLAASLALASAGCERSADSAPSPPAAVEPASRHGLATPTAFDLAPAPDGAVLAWAAAGGGTLRTTRFDADGQPSGNAGAEAREQRLGRRRGRRRGGAAGAGHGRTHYAASRRGGTSEMLHEAAWRSALMLAP